MINIEDIEPIFDIVDGGYYVGFWKMPFVHAKSYGKATN